MALELNHQIIERILKARHDLHLTQLELAEKAGISLRSIKDIERGRRISFNEDTLIRLCRALELNYDDLFEEKPIANRPRFEVGRKAKVWWSTFAVALVLALLGYALSVWVADSSGRIDWVSDDPVPVAPFNPETWTDSTWHGNGFAVNYYHLKHAVALGKKVAIELKWSYHFETGSTPLYYINAFAQWDPDREIPLLRRQLFGAGCDTFNFETTCPQEPGLYQIRVFFSSSYSAVPSYYGRPPPNQLSAPSSAPYFAIPIQVIDER